MPVSVVAGLGNPGLEYENTRHNAGFVLLDALATEFDCRWAKDRKSDVLYATHERRGRKLFLLKPQAYVNRSGSCLREFFAFHKLSLSELAVVYDEINLPLGRAKISVGGSAGGHNGIADILRYFPDEFVRFRVGIGPKAPPWIDMKDFVLGRWRTEELKVLESETPGFLEGIKLLIDSGPQSAMNRVNRRPGKPDDGAAVKETTRQSEQETKDENSGKTEIPGYGDP